MRSWKTHDLYDLMRATGRGNLPMRCHTNADMESWDDFYSVPLEVWWPDGIKNNESSVDMEFTIDTNVPVPFGYGKKDPSGTNAAITEALKKLEVGQSFFVPLRASSDKASHLQAMFASCRKWMKGKNFISRKVHGDDKKETGIRIWRLE